MKTATQTSPAEKARSNIQTKSSKATTDATRVVSLHPPAYGIQAADKPKTMLTAESQNLAKNEEKPVELKPKEAFYTGKTELKSKTAPYPTPKNYLTPKEETQPQAKITPPKAPQVLQKKGAVTSELPKKDQQKTPGHQLKKEKQRPQKIVTNQPSADKIIGFSQLSASQMAAQHATLGKDVSSQLQQDKQENQRVLEPLKAQMQGVDKLDDEKLHVQSKKAAGLREEQREADPTTPRLAKHQHHTEKPPEAEVPKTKEEGGFFSRLFGSLTDFFNGLSEMLDYVPETDQGISTQAGKVPQQQLKGKANPERANEQRKKRDQEVQREKEQMDASIRQHPGPNNVQPIQVETSIEVPTLKTEVPEVQTTTDEHMQNYLDVQMPSEVRELSDQDMEEILEPHLKEPRGKLQKEIVNQQQNRSKAIEANQQKLHKLNAEAQTEQEAKVREARTQMHGEMQRGEAETRRLVTDYQQTTHERHQEMNTEVIQRAADDHKKAQRKLDKGTEDAERLRTEAEDKVRKERKKVEDQKRDRNLLQRAGDFLSDVWNALTSFVKEVFEKARAAIKTIINKAKEAAIWLIEQGRKAIVKLINTFKEFLKDLVNTYLAEYFPALAKALNAAIDLIAKVMTKGVNFIADRLKKGVTALAKELAEAIDKVLAAIQEGVMTYLNVLGAVLSGDFAKALRIMFLALCKVAGVDPKVVMDFIDKAGNLIMNIFNDPLTFLSNALNAVKSGVSNFAMNILQHLGKGLLEWLMGPLGSLNIKMPEKFNLEGIFSLTLQVLGLTYDNIRARAVKKLDEHYPDKGEQIIGALEKTAGIVKEIIQDGPKALWKHLQDFVGNIQQTIMEGIKSFVIERLVRAGVEMLIAMSNPVGGVIKLVSMLYDFVMFIVDNIERIAKFVKTVFDTVSDIAAGKIDTAAKFIESVMAQTIPMILDFLARLLKLGGISKKIQEIIERIRKPINEGIDKVLELIIKLAKRVVSGKGKKEKDKKDKDNKGDDWWNFEFTFETVTGEKHRVFIDGGKDNPQITIASNQQLYKTFLKNTDQELQKRRKAVNKSSKKSGKRDDDVIKWFNESRKNFQEADRNNEKLRKDLKTANSAKDKKKIEDLRTAMRALRDDAKKLMDHLMGEPGSDNIPKTKIDPPSKLHGGFATYMKAQPLTLKGEKGSVPNPNTVKTHWENLVLRKNKGGSYYVLGHLLNEHLHGKGIAENLTPLTRTANSKHSSDYEEPIKDAIFNGAVLSYDVKVEYTKNNLPTDADVDAKAATKKWSSSDVDKIKKVIKSEKYVPEYIELNAYNYDPIQKRELTPAERSKLAKIKQVNFRNVIIKNEANFSIDNYEVVAISAKDLLGAYVDDIDGMLEKGVDKDLAEAIYAKVKEKNAKNEWVRVVKHLDGIPDMPQYKKAWKHAYEGGIPLIRFQQKITKIRDTYFLILDGKEYLDENIIEVWDNGDQDFLLKYRNDQVIVKEVKNGKTTLKKLSLTFEQYVRNGGLKGFVFSARKAIENQETK